MKYFNLTKLGSNHCFILSDVCCRDKIRCFLLCRSPLTTLPTSARECFLFPNTQYDTLHYGFACIALIIYSGILLHRRSMFFPPPLAIHFCSRVTPALHECADQSGVWPLGFSSLTERVETCYIINNHSFSHNTTPYRLCLWYCAP